MILGFGQGEILQWDKEEAAKIGIFCGKLND